MFEMKVTVEAPELTAAVNNLAAAISGTKPPLQIGQAPAQMPTPTQPAAAPQQPPMDATRGTASMSVPTNPAPMPAAPVQAAPSQFPAPGAPAAFAQPQQPPAPVAGVPVAGAPQYTVDQIMAAGATLMDAGKVNELMNLLHSFGVQAVMDLKPEQLGAFATELRKLGAAI